MAAAGAGALSRFLGMAKRLAASSAPRIGEWGASVVPPVQPLSFVLCNESADLDSVASAVMLAWGLDKYATERAPRSSDREALMAPKGTQAGELARRYVPVINAPRDELPFRAELEWVLARAGARTDDLLCFSEVDFEKRMASQTPFELLLVDHNMLTASQSFLADRVRGVVDHHKDEAQYVAATASLRVIEPVGSASSLVTILLDELAPALLRDPAAYLLLAAIVLDTGNPATKQRRAKDEKALALLAEQLSESTLEGEYAQLLRRRLDLSHLTPRQLLLRDIKFGVAGATPFAISTVPIPLASLCAREGFDVATLQLIREGRDGRGPPLGLFCVMTAFSDPTSTALKRELLCAGPDPRLTDGVCAALDRASPTVVLEALGSLPALRALDEARVLTRAFAQRNAEATRKQLWPLVADALSKL